jgi:hypothetical protein
MRNLTVVDPVLERAEMNTAPGMAHWAGSGPEGSVCGKCRSFGYEFVKPNGDHSFKRSACGKFYTMTHRNGGSLDERQSGCKYFEKTPQA